MAKSNSHSSSSSSCGNGNSKSSSSSSSRFPSLQKKLLLLLTATATTITTTTTTTSILLPRPASATQQRYHQQCHLAKRGLSQDILLLGTALTPEGALPDTAIYIRSGRIAHIGDVCNLGLRGGFSVDGDASVIDCTGGGGGGGGGSSTSKSKSRSRSRSRSKAAVISPGFINTHEHIDFSTVRPFAPASPRVLHRHRHDWRVGARGHARLEAVVNGSLEEAVAWGELRHLFSGTTSVIGGEMVPGLTRNLDFPDGLEAGLDEFPEYFAAVYDTFPLRDKDGEMRVGDCDYGSSGVISGSENENENENEKGKKRGRGRGKSIDQERASTYHRYIGHVSEGVDDAAANEFACLSNSTYDTIPMPLPSSSSSSTSDTGDHERSGLSADILGPNIALVHALGLTPTDLELVARRGTKVVWSPRSNMFLYGRTLNATALLDLDVTVALGTDWLPSGSATMGREAVCAAAVARESLGLRIPPRRLWEMATANAAVVAGFEADLGSLEVGKLADIVVFGKREDVEEEYEYEEEEEEEEEEYEEEEGEDDDTGKGNGEDEDQDEEGFNRKPTTAANDPFGQAIFAPQEAVELVLRGGKILLASAALRELTTESCEPVTFGRSEKMVCVADELGTSFRELEASLQGMYPAILPDIPPEEPPCR